MANGWDEDDDDWDGDIDDSDWDEPCPFCKGIGETSCDIGGGEISMECPECGGTGIES